MLVCGEPSCLESNIAALVYANPDHHSQTDIGFTSGWLSQALRLMSWNAWLILCTHPKCRFEVDRIIRGHSNLHFVQELIWTYEFGNYTRKRFVPAHENILVYRQGFPSFYWQPVAIQSQRLRDGDPRGDLRGRTPGTVWTFPRTPGNSIDRCHLQRTTGRSCQPEELCTRIVKAYTRLSDLVVDLFSQGGTMPFVCYNIGRPCISLDLDESRIKQNKTRFKLEVETHWKRM